MYDEHGGGCCGISHVWDFPRAASPDWLNRQITGAVEEFEDERREYHEDRDQPIPWVKFGRLIEVSLTDEQMMVWAHILKEKGFRLGQRFKNDNSGNYVTLLTYATKRPAHKAPYKW